MSRWVITSCFPVLVLNIERQVHGAKVGAYQGGLGHAHHAILPSPLACFLDNLCNAIHQGVRNRFTNIEGEEADAAFGEISGLLDIV